MNLYKVEIVDTENESIEYFVAAEDMRKALDVIYERLINIKYIENASYYQRIDFYEKYL